MKVILIGSAGDFKIENKGLGIQTYMYQLAKRLEQYKEVKLFLSEPNPMPVIGNSISFFISNSFKNFNKFDIVHSLDVKPFIPLFKWKGTWIATIHDFWPIIYPNAYISDRTAKNYIYKNILRFGLNLQLKADFLIAVSTTTKEVAIKKFGYEKDKIKVVNSGLPEKFLNLTINQINENNSFTVGYIGAFRPNKNLSFAIKAFKQLDNKNISFKLFGDTSFDYKKLMKEAIGYKNIYFGGFIPENQKINTYKSFDCFVFPSLYEGFGLPILEAQACGLPVIIYKYAKIPKEVRKYCFEAERPEHMAHIIEDLKENGYNENLRKKAVTYARSFTWEKCARETLEVYKKVLK